MSEKQIISLVIRIGGLFGILYVVRHWAIIWHKSGSIHYDNWWKLIAEICMILIGIYMLSGARLLVRFMTTKNSDDDNQK